MQTLTEKHDCRLDGRISDDVRYRAVNSTSSWSSSSSNDDEEEEEEEGIFITSIQNCTRFGRVSTS